MADEIDAHAPRPLVVCVPVQAERAQVALEFSAQEGRGLPAAGVAGALGAEEEEVSVGVGAGGEGGEGRRGGGGG